MLNQYFLAALLVFSLPPSDAASLHAEEIPSWIVEVTTPPENIPAPAKPLAPLLVSSDGKKIETPAQWEQRRKELLAKWNEFLQPFAYPDLAPKYKVVSTEKVGSLVRERIEYEVEPGVVVPAYVLRPADLKENELRPGILALHPTTAETIEPIAGLSGPKDKQSAIHLAEAGFVVLCPENFLWQGTNDYNAAVALFQKRHPGSLGMSKMLWDARRATTILQALPHVEKDRLGTFGHSLGAKEVLYLMAFDERIKAGVFSEGGIALDATNWDAPWYLGEAIHARDFSLDHHQLLALIAPRALLVLAGESGRGSADGLRSWPHVKAAQPVFRLLDAERNLGILNHGEGHSIPLAARKRAIEWLGRQLRR